MKGLYSYWVVFAMGFFFFLFFIPLLFLSKSVRTHRLALMINHWWAVGFFRLAGIPVKLNKQFSPKKNEQYIICSNHFSYLDIPAVGLLPIPIKFFGKKELSFNILFNKIYNKLHVTVDRSTVKSRAEGFEQAKKSIKQGFNLCFFPEGGIKVKNYPEMKPFKHGAFRLSAEFDIPILPLTFADNYHIIKQGKKFQAKWSPCRITIHPPMKAASNTEEEIKKLQNAVYETIQTELNRYFST